MCSISSYGKSGEVFPGAHLLPLTLTVIFRHGHLMLFDDANQVEVRYVISLAHHDVSIHGGEGEIPEGELWLKRNAICLSRRLESLADLGGPTPPFFLFSENLSEKEDFYFAMLQNQAKMWDAPDAPPALQPFDVKHIVTLVQRLHSSEEQLQTRWINAVLGRLFLALYRTPEMEEFIRQKITKKISRVNKPTFVSKIALQRIDMGEGAPFIINPRLKDLTVDGNCCVETDVQYAGNFRVEIAATVRIDLGQRFKAREVDIVLAVVLKKLEGHLLIRFKPPPSNRAWLSFESMPDMDMDIEPIVSSKQITYGIILRNIESRIREVVAESLVQPFWDDIPFLDTLSQRFRGGIWKRDIPQPDGAADDIPDESGGAPSTPGGTTARHGSESIDVLKAHDERTRSAPALSDSLPLSPPSRKGSADAAAEPDRGPTNAVSPVAAGSLSGSPPRVLRPQTFANAADPVLTADHGQRDKAGSDVPSEERPNATSAMIEITTRSPPESPAEGAGELSDGRPPSRDPSFVESIESGGTPDHQHGPNGAGSSSRPTSRDRPGDAGAATPLRGPANRSTASLASTGTAKRRTTLETLTRTLTPETNRSQASITLGNATSAAKKWGLTMFGKGESRPGAEPSRPAGTPDEPIGRGHPLPPPGTPLPTPAKFGFRRGSSAVSVPRRKPVGPPEEQRGLPRRKPVDGESHRPEELLVVEAPPDSTPNSPVVDLAPGDDDTDADRPAPAVQPPVARSQSDPSTTASSTPDTPTEGDQSSPSGSEADSTGARAERDKHGMEILSATDGIIPG